jgi:hypothetical protein
MLLFASPVHAWNKAGHMVSAAVAYHSLKHDSPNTVARVVAILKEHPQYESSWLHRINALNNATDEDKEMMLFMQAARWPDDARGNEEYPCGRRRPTPITFCGPTRSISTKSKTIAKMLRSARWPCAGCFT